MSEADHWNLQARQWNLIGPPLRPAAEDVDIAESLLAAHSPPPGEKNLVALLGVTPELVHMRWPSATRLLAIDRCPGMIAGVFPGRVASVPTAVARGDWLHLPLPDAGCEWVVGDGCCTLLDSPAAYAAFVREIRRVLRPGGHLLLRLFTRPREPEPEACVVEDLQEGRIGNFHIFKWRLAMALHGELAAGVRIADIWSRWRAARINPHDLARRLDWQASEIATIEAYRDGTARYTFPTVAEARAAFGDVFEELACHFPTYELGERCPTLLWRSPGQPRPGRHPRG